MAKKILSDNEKAKMLVGEQFELKIENEIQALVAPLPA